MPGQAIRPTEAGRAKIREMHWMMCEMVKVFAAECDNDFERTWNAIAEFAKLHQNTKAATLFELVWADYLNAIASVCEHGEGGEAQAGHQAAGPGDRGAEPEVQQAEGGHDVHAGVADGEAGEAAVDGVASTEDHGAGAETNTPEQTTTSATVDGVPGAVANRTHWTNTEGIKVLGL
jgi:hypothetical protein